MSRMSPRNPVKARDRVTLKNSRDGAIERNLTSGEDVRISKRTVDYDLRGGEEHESFSQLGKSGKANRKHKQRRPQMAENGAAAAKAEPQTVSETSGAPKQPEAAAVTPIRSIDEGREVIQYDMPPTADHSITKTILTSGKSKVPKQSRQRYAIVEENVSNMQESVPQPTLKQEQSALQCDKSETPITSEPSSALQFTREDKQPKLSRKQKKRQQRQNRQNHAPRDTTAQNTDNTGISQQQTANVAVAVDAESAGSPATDVNAEYAKPPDMPPPASIADSAIVEGGSPLPGITGDDGKADIITPQKSADTLTSELKTDKPSKLQFGDDEGEPITPPLSKVKQQKKYGKALAQADKTVTKLDEAKSKLPAKKKRYTERVFDEETGKSGSPRNEVSWGRRAKKKLCFESEIKSQGEHLKGAKPLRPVKAVGNSALMFAHTKIYQVQRDNVAVEAAHKVEIAAEGVTRSALRHHKLAPYKKVEKLERMARKKSINAAYQKALAENPKLKGNPNSKAFQKRKIKKDYAKAAREAEKASKRAKKAGGMIADAGKVIAGVIKRHPLAAGVVVLIILLLFCVISLFGALGSAGSGGLGGVFAVSYLAEDADIDNAELTYTEWETDLLMEIAGAETNHSGYDEYRYNVGDISHNPFELIAYLTAKYQGFTYAAVYAELQTLFNEQYTLTFTPTTETRYADPDDADEDGDYEPYDWNVMTVTLTARSFSDVISTRLIGEEAAHYAVLMQSKGARQYLANPFGDMNWLPYVSSYYGYRIHPIDGGKNYHKGVDIALPLGTEILSGQDGMVAFSGYSGDYGNVVVIENSDGLVSKYAHCDNLLVSVGQAVKAGDALATVGNTGASTGAHLHLEILKNRQYLNALLFADTGSYTAAPNYSYAGSPMGDGSYAALIAEAEQFLGYPYVWSGSSPSTSFDCSGYISWILVHSGVKNVGRLGATGLYNISAPVSSAEAMPGDLVFFHSTYSTTNPVTHVGLYVGTDASGRPRMLHCGDPIQYTYIDTAYWQQHFYSFGRVTPD